MSPVVQVAVMGRQTQHGKSMYIQGSSSEMSPNRQLRKDPLCRALPNMPTPAKYLSKILALKYPVQNTSLILGAMEAD
jgi:hypothetical protein